MKRFLVLMVLVGVMGGAILSFSAMHHSMNGVMSADCPIASLHISVCPMGSLIMVTHYLSMYQTFTNVLISSIVMQMLTGALLFVMVALVLRRHLASILYLFILFRNFSAKLYRPQALSRWLSLLLNSPSMN